MISWIQRSFQKHFRWVFALVLAAMVIPLVVIFSPSSGVGRGANKLLERPFFGHNLGNEVESRRLFSDGSISAQLRGSSNLQGGQLQQYSLQRAAALAVADELHLPTPTEAQVAKFVSTLRAFQNEQGQFDQKRYTAFGDSLKTGSQVTVADVNRVLRDDTRVADLLATIIAGPGYVLPHDVTQQLIRSDSSWTVQVATLDYASFAPTLNPGEDSLKKFYDENSAHYDVPARPRFSYVEFKGADFLPTAGPTEAELRAFYTANAEAFPVPPEAAPASAAPVDNFPKIRAKVETALKANVSARLASKAANELTLALYEHKLTANSAELASFLADRHLTIAPVAPFAPDNPPADKPWLGAYPDQIARLGQSHFFSDPLPTMDSYVVLLWNESLPAYKPLFAEVHDRVTADFKEVEKRRLFNEQGKILRAKLQAATGTPAAFAAAAAADKLEVKTYAGFTLRQPPQDLPYNILNSLTTTEAGQVAEMTSTDAKGFLVYVQEKKLPDLSPTSPRYLELKKQLELFTAGTNETSYLNALVERELKKSEPATR